MKKFIGITSHSIKAVKAYKLRCVFCLLSVALGISSISVIVAAVEGTFKKAFDLVDKFGPDALLIVGGGEESRAVEMRSKTITVDDVQALKDAFPNAYSVMPMAFVMNATAAYRDKKTLVRIMGATDLFSESWGWPVSDGSDLTANDVKTMKNVCLIGSHVAELLFGSTSPLGKYVLVDNKIYVMVIGVLASRGTTPSGENLDDRIAMPLTTVMKKIQNEIKYVGIIRARFYNQKNLGIYAKEVVSFFRQRHKVPPGEPDDVTVISPTLIFVFLAALTGSLVIFLGISGIISLIVAGFVLANLFLLSVNERTKEIGIRRALGATRGDILVQFVGEAVIITSVGGVVGFVLGFISSRFITLIADFPIYFSFNSFLIGLVLSWIVGIISGLQPARRAAEISPIEAIRK